MQLICLSYSAWKCIAKLVLSFGGEVGGIQEAGKLHGILQLQARDSSLGCVQVLWGSKERKSFLRSPRTCGAAHSWGPRRRAGSAVVSVLACRHGRCSAGRGASIPAVLQVLCRPLLICEKNRHFHFLQASKGWALCGRVSEHGTCSGKPCEPLQGSTGYVCWQYIHTILES